MTSVATNVDNAELNMNVDDVDDADDSSSNGYGGGYQSRGGSRQEGYIDRNNLGPMEVAVDHSIDKAMRVLKRKLIREGILKELKARRYYEKPCERRKRKGKESVKKRRKEEARIKKFVNQFLGQ